MIDAEIRELTPQPFAAVRLTQPLSEMDLAAFATSSCRTSPTGSRTWASSRRDRRTAATTSSGRSGSTSRSASPVSAPPSNLRTYDDAEPGELFAELPGGPAAITVHRGAYDTLSGVYDVLQDWIHDQGRDEAPDPGESDVDDPGEVPMDEAKTEVIWPIA